MPTITIFAVDKAWAEQVSHLLLDLATEAAARLSTPELMLDADHISVRVLIVEYDRMMSPIELEITAHPFPSRVQYQDNICGALRGWLAERAIPARVWLRLGILGYGYCADPTLGSS